MGKFRKKPVVVEAFQVTDQDGTDEEAVPAWFWEALETFQAYKIYGGGFAILTLEGEMRADRGDWIIRGVNGEIYPCKPDIFEKTYEPVDA